LDRSRAIIVATVLVIISIVAPLGSMMYLAWTRAVNDEQARLELFARRAIQRANISLREIRSALYAVEPLNLLPCSPDHIARMRRLTVNTRSVDEIGYFENGLLKCTSWGLVNGRVEQTPADFVTEDGLEVTLRMQPLITQGNAMMALQYRSHNVLTVPSRFSDVIVDPGMRLAVATSSGQILGDLNTPDPDVVRRVVANPVNGIDDERLIAVARGDSLVAVAMEPRSFLFERMREEELRLVPIGVVLSVLMVGLVMWSLRRRLSPLGELEIAVKKREFIVHYQPIIELAGGNCVGAEALVRWLRPDGSLVQPDLFIPLAEDSGLIMAITDQVIDKVIEDLGELLINDRSVHIAINLGADDIRTGRVIDVLQQALARSGVEAQQIWLEATERGFINVLPARLTLGNARALGHAVVIDDFGTGYSSLSHLQSLPLDALKIDKSFIDTIGTDSAISSVTPHIIGMARTLYLKIVAEGVETEAQADYLRRQKVDYAQGWLYAMPMPAAAFIAYHRQNRCAQEVVAQAAHGEAAVQSDPG